MIFEVLSPTTEAYDRGEKFDHYKSFDTLRQYVLVSHGERTIEVRTRSGGAWTVGVAREDDHVPLASGGEFAVRDLYDAAARSGITRVSHELDGAWVFP